MDKIKKHNFLRRLKKRLRMTLGAKITIAMALMTIAFIVFSVISTRYIFFQMSILMEVDHMYATGQTALGVSGTANSEKACEIVRNIYASLPEQEKGKQNTHDYLSEFPSIDSGEYGIDFSLIDSVFKTIREKNKTVSNVGLCLLDMDTKRVIIVRDYNKNHCGQMEIFNYKTAITLTTESPLYNDRLKRGDDGLRNLDLRVLVPINDEDLSNLQGFLFMDVHDENIGVWCLIFVVAYVLVFNLVAVAIWIIISFIIKRSIIRPIIRLSNAADDWAQAPDKLEEKYYFRDLKIRSNDEVRDLKEAMSTMETRIHEYMVGLEKTTEEKLKLSSELEITARLQANMLPEKLTGENNSFEVFPFMRPARLVGGDFYDFFMVGEDKIGLVIADVSDKGVPASLFMVVSRTIIKDVTQNEYEDLEKAMIKANNMLCENNKETMFVTAFIGVYDLKTKILSYVNAGHEDPIVYNKREDKYKIIYEPHDILMGVKENAVYHKREIYMNQGDRLFLYTDGVTEAIDVSDKLFGLERLINCLNSDTSLAGDDILNNLWNQISQYQEGKNQADDVTMLIFEV